MFMITNSPKRKNPPRSNSGTVNLLFKRHAMKRALLLSALLLGTSLTACSDIWFGESDNRGPLPGERISVLDYEKDLQPDKDAAVSAFSAGEPVDNESWPQAGGDARHAMGNVALNGNPAKIWSVDIGEGSRSRLPLTAQPVVAGQTIFALDTDSELSAYSAIDGKRYWRVKLRPDNEKDPVISGGIAADNGTLYVTAGYNEIVAVDGANGAVKWRAALTSPSRAAPTIAGGRLFVTTLSNSVLAIHPENGSVEWEFAGLGQGTGLIGAASPAATNDMVIPAFSSGEIYALRSANGSVAWSDNLASALRLGGMTALSDIRGLPVVEGNTVYAISYGGKMAAIDLNSGARLWSRDIAGAKTPWLAGNRLYVISSDNQIVSVDKDKGTVIWVSQLARFKNTEKRTGPILWTGPVMAGNRLMAFSSDGRVAEINPENGTLVREWSSGKDIRIAPVIAGKTLYLLAEDGDLVAYK